ncbi:eukaryotic translation initiation factor 2 subunit 2 isoform X2 [Myotis lucifugus]|uniref:eukaryotic translation initiation factor 2 subunit 2 isoform X2 n=1 Tax=Myotis lucifugus TaxID=59463 RepID=UPI000CCC5D85|nr:eukaryotic translation initiation factor 2 subunit 2 isoform X2 [Myotis lucifugus]
MSGDEMIFDPTMSKKKKKKKKPFMLDEEGDAQTEETQPSETKEVEPEPTEDKDVEADEEDNRKKDASDDLDDLNFFNQKKKKKKTKKIFDIDEAEEGVKDLKIESDVQEPAEPEDDLDIMLGNKKKKKKNVKFPDEDEILEKDEALEDEDSKKDDGISFSNQTGPAWAGSERDYTYEELLNRVFNIMREKNPDMVAGEKRKFVMKPPQVVRVGTKKTSFVNFTDICKLKRCYFLKLFTFSVHVSRHLLVDYIVSPNISSHFYWLNWVQEEYVTCHTCRSPDTILQKDTRLYFLQCETCHSRCSVASIKTGFQAVTGKRAQLRAKAN